MVKRNWPAAPGRACVWGPGVLCGVKGVVCTEWGVALVSMEEWSLMLLCFNDLKGQNKREYSYLKFPSWIKSSGWPTSKLKTWLGTSQQAQDMFPLWKSLPTQSRSAGLGSTDSSPACSECCGLQRRNCFLRKHLIKEQSSVPLAVLLADQPPWKDRREKKKARKMGKEILLHWHKLPRKWPGNLPWQLKKSVCFMIILSKSPLRFVSVISGDENRIPSWSSHQLSVKCCASPTLHPVIKSESPSDSLCS